MKPSKVAALAIGPFMTCLMVMGCPRTTVSAVPDKLQKMEAKAEDIIDIVPAGSWDSIATDVTTIRHAWKAYKPQASVDGATQAMTDALASAINRLKAAATKMKPPATMQAANDVSSAVIELFDLYNPTIPADIGRLDVIERQVVLDTAATDFAAAGDSLVRANDVWANVRPSVLAHNGSALATDFQNSLDAQQLALGSQNAAALTPEAQAALELVDALESLY